MPLTKVQSTGITDSAVTADKIGSNAVTTAKINADAVTDAKIADNAVVTAAINADAVTGAKIADDAINSEHFTDGSIDTAHIADSQVTAVKTSGVSNMVQLNKAESTGTASDITFDNFSATYNVYKIFCHWHNSSSNTEARFRMRNSSGDITSSIYRYSVSRTLLTSSSTSINASASEYDGDKFRLGNAGSTFDDHRQTAEITVFRPNEPDSCMVHFKNAFWSSDNNEWVNWNGVGWCNTQEAHTGIKFYQSGGTINDYYYIIYGLADS